MSSKTKLWLAQLLRWASVCVGTNGDIFLIFIVNSVPFMLLLDQCVCACLCFPFYLFLLYFPFARAHKIRLFFRMRMPSRICWISNVSECSRQSVMILCWESEVHTVCLCDTNKHRLYAMRIQWTTMRSHIDTRKPTFPLYTNTCCTKTQSVIEK